MFTKKPSENIEDTEGKLVKIEGRLSGSQPMSAKKPPVFDVPLKPVSLQNYTAVEKEEVILMCELSKASGEVKWFKDGNEIYPSKNVLFQSDGKKRMLVIKKTAKSDMAAYTCDCGTDKTTAELSIEGNTCGLPGSAHLKTLEGILRRIFVNGVNVSKVSIKYLCTCDNPPCLRWDDSRI
uniref:Ig-like domain-containing protein n=1 Tax=Neogobius melanostomus TaxID=47308 RepID=A0A8C6U917_9GOBI